MTTQLTNMARAMAKVAHSALVLSHRGMAKAHRWCFDAGGPALLLCFPIYWAIGVNFRCCCAAFDRAILTEQERT